MRFDDETLDLIVEKTDGCCHICGKKVCWSNYGAFGRRGAWEVEHSRAQARAGTHHLNNLFPACIPCNRAKRAGTTRAARASHGRTIAPLSAAAKGRRRVENAVTYGAAAGLGALAMGAAGPVGWAAAGIAALFGFEAEPDPQKGKRRR